MIYLGFDTSNYTTSVACCGDISINERRLLEVKKGCPFSAYKKTA